MALELLDGLIVVTLIVGVGVGLNVGDTVGVALRWGYKRMSDCKTKEYELLRTWELPLISSPFGLDCYSNQ